MSEKFSGRVLPHIMDFQVFRGMLRGELKSAHPPAATRDSDSVSDLAVAKDL